MDESDVIKYPEQKFLVIESGDLRDNYERLTIDPANSAVTGYVAGSSLTHTDIRAYLANGYRIVGLSPFDKMLAVVLEKLEK